MVTALKASIDIVREAKGGCQQKKSSKSADRGARHDAEIVVPRGAQEKEKRPEVPRAFLLKAER